MNANTLAFAQTALDVEFRRREFQEHREPNRAQALTDAITASKTAYNVVVPPAPLPVLLLLQNVQATLDNGFTDMGSRLTAVEGRLTAVEGRLTAVEDRLTAIEDRLTAVEGHLSNMEVKQDQDRVIASRSLLWECPFPDSAQGFNRYYRAAGTPNSLD